MPLLIISCYLLVIICAGLYFGLIFSYSDLYLKKAEEMYGKMQLMSDIPYLEGEINLYTNRIWCVLTYHYLTKEHTVHHPSRRSSFLLLHSDHGSYRLRTLPLSLQRIETLQLHHNQDSKPDSGAPALANDCPRGHSGLHQQRPFDGRPLADINDGRSQPFHDNSAGQIHLLKR